MAKENPSWGAPRIHGELKKLGFDVCQNTISNYLPKKPPDPRKMQNWKTFLKNHRDVTCAMDFFVVPTVNFTLLYVFFIIDHATRKIVHWNITEHPNSFWVRLQLRETFPWNTAPKYLIFDRDRIFDKKVKATIKALGIKSKIIGYKMPWQNGIAERWVRSAREDMIHHVIIFNERHLRRLITEYVDYYHNDRTHIALGKDTPGGRPIEQKLSANAKVVALPRLGGLHHRYAWQEKKKLAA